MQAIFMKWTRVGLVVLLVCAGLVATHFWLSASSRWAETDPGEKIAHYPDTVPGGDFKLTAHDGRMVSLSNFPGQSFLVIFGYTYCPDVCPTSLATLSESLELLGKEAKSVQPLFITLDPERDGVAALSQYLAHFDPRILGLTGSQAEIEAVARQYRVYFSKFGEGPDYTIDHSAAYFLVSPKGDILTYLPHDVSAQELARVILEFAPLRSGGSAYLGLSAAKEGAT